MTNFSLAGSVAIRTSVPTARPGTVALRSTRTELQWAVPLVLWDAPQGFDTSGSPDARACHTVSWRLSGALVHRVLPGRQRVEAMVPNGFLLQPAARDLRFVAEGAIRFADFYIDEAFVRRLATEYAGDRGDRPDLFRDDRVMRSDAEVPQMLGAYLRRALDEEEPPTRLEMDCRASLLTLQMLRKHSLLCVDEGRIKAGALSPFHLRRVCEAMASDLAADVPLRKLAQMAGVSYHHFCHAFKASTGMPPHQWLVEQRVERACQLLRLTRNRITDIAAEVGYDDPNQLARVFRKRRGTTPLLYRRLHQVEAFDFGA